MGGVKREEGVLKLVRPGGIVEVHKTPITASQVMEKYPRHCVTRPDFFTYPWIVVRPESTLSLGRVFYIVPRHTIWKLLQKKGLVKGGNNTLPKPPQELDDITSYDEVGSRTFQKDPVKSACQPLTEPPSFRKLARVSPEKIASKKDSEKSKACCDPKFPDGYLFKESVQTNQNDDIVRQKIDNSLMMIKYKEKNTDIDTLSCFSMRRMDTSLEAKTSTSKVTTTTLKPCLRKSRATNNRTSTGPRVRFLLPEDYIDKYE